ncbi:hypothetical protein ZYGR_0AF04320 [Zygosaccharomyces rouxii]|uniref:Sulfhydryl oxidase n=1 Tax=Zygosaccharomyces rouxii TaxID=4956 RepID=A0A1Q3A8Q7_ZYGRO|nr:hypothetical protein ZYGR_0AF04320 [Zygosaccharomyces rouxii]
MTNPQPQEGVSGRKIIYDENGKPCRSCNTLLDFRFATGKITGKQAASAAAAAAAAAASTPAGSLGPTATEKIPGSKTHEKGEPLDVEGLGRSSWNVLHTITANYPDKPSNSQQSEMRQFLQLFSHIYPCSWCASDFERYLKTHAPKLGSRDEFGRWMCEAHNEVNAKLNKETFDCNFWEKRWKDGWDD